VFVGGSFSQFAGSFPRVGLAAIDAASGLPTSFVANTNSFSSVNAILLSGGTLFAGGNFTSIAGQGRKGFAAFADPSFLPNLGVPPHPGSASRFVLAQNSPNPFRRASVIRFALAEAGNTRLAVFDASGRQVRTLLDGARLEPGEHTLELDATGLKPGLYWYRLECNGQAQTRRMVAIP
jgi:hypothetical protein